MTTFRSAAIATAALMCLTRGVSAQSYSVDAGTINQVSAPVVDKMQVQQLTGVTLTAYWGNSGPTTLAFQQSGSNWGFFGTGLDLFTGSGTSDTFFSTWTLNNKTNGLTRLVFDAAGTNTAFDMAYGFLGLAEGTPGSNIGNNLDAYRCSLVFCFDRWNTQVTYRNAVAVIPNGPVGDLYTQMDVQFGRAISSDLRVDALMTFDTDLVTPVPEPASLLLVGSGLIGLVTAARRRRVIR